MLLDALNSEQRKACEWVEGPNLIIAGAGSGKTRVLTYKIAYLIENGVNPLNILALTFTNKAATEMKERIVELVGDKAKNILMGTFHSIFSRILRIEAERLGYLNSFTIYDTEDSKSVIRSIVKEFNLDEKLYNKSYILNRISAAKSCLISPDAYESNVELMAEDRAGLRPYISKIYREYNHRLRRNMAMDFDDLLFNMNVLLRDNNDLLLKYQERFRYILVDEYQDTNFAQYYIVKKLSARHRNITVVGDDAQSIYAFRGADIRNILDFQKDYSDSKFFKLEQNYRSTGNIVEAANSVITHNKAQIAKKVWTSNDKGRKINYYNAENDKEEAKWISDLIKNRIRMENANYGDFAILYRTNQQSRVLEESLRFQNIPYRIFSGISFYGRKEIKDILAYFNLVVNNSDDEAFLRIINYPARSIGDTTINKLKILANEENTSLFDACVNHIDKISLTPKAKQSIIDFVVMIQAFTIEKNKVDAYDLGVRIIGASNIIPFLQKDTDPSIEDKIDNINELIGALQAFVDSEEESVLDEMTGEEISLSNKTLDIFVQQASLITETDRKEGDDQNKVSLMTIHSAKGLEFPYIFVAGLEENLFPSVLSIASSVELEEERRLFYVAITRAKKELALSCAKMRFRNGTMTFNEESRFLSEIDKEYMVDDYSKGKDINKLKTPSFSNSDFVSINRNLKKLDTLPKPIGGTPVKDMNDFCEGMEVLHDKFGKGKIISLEGKGDDTKAEVSFEAFGVKKLVLRFAKLKTIK